MSVARKLFDILNRRIFWRRTMKKYDVFLFDADGTLFDYDMAEARALPACFEDTGYAYTDCVRDIYREVNSRLWDDYDKGAISKEDLQTLRFKLLFDRIGLDWDIGDFNAKYLRELGKGSFLIDGAEKLCRQIRSAKKSIYIVTNGIHSVQRDRIENSRIKPYVEDYYVSELVGYKKPSVEYFDYIFAKNRHIDKNKTIIVGDSLIADIAGGNNVGIDSCWYNGQGIENRTGIVPTYEIGLLREALKFV
jgi:YjjG family noncanonical pyrimidine nucleotidase